MGSISNPEYVVKPILDTYSLALSDYISTSGEKIAMLVKLCDGKQHRAEVYLEKMDDSKFCLRSELFCRVNVHKVAVSYAIIRDKRRVVFKKKETHYQRTNVRLHVDSSMEFCVDEPDAQYELVVKVAKYTCKRSERQKSRFSAKIARNLEKLMEDVKLCDVQ